MLGQTEYVGQNDNRGLVPFMGMTLREDGMAWHCGRLELGNFKGEALHSA